MTKRPLNAEWLTALSGGIAPPPAICLDESLPITADERFTWERRLNRYLNSCGCAEGAVGLFVGLAVVLIVFLIQSKPWTAWQVAAALALPIALLVGGKTLGRWLARLRFRKVCKLLLSQLAVNIAQGDPHA